MHNWQKIKTDSKLRRNLLLREKINRTIRLFFQEQAFHEVETPLLLSYPGTEPFLNQFSTELKTASGEIFPAFLATSPEYAMKKLLVANLGNIFQICKAFRNQESLGTWHNPEFSLLEFYHVGVNYRELMADFEHLLLFLCQKLDRDPQKFVYQAKTYDLTPPYPKFRVTQLFQKYLDLDVDQLFDLRALTKKALALQYDLSNFRPPTPEIAWEELYQQLFFNEIAPHLEAILQPVIVYDYPASQSALARPCADDSRLAERFEVYFAGMELGNAFGELTDSQLLNNNLQKDLHLAQVLGKKNNSIDKSFLEALDAGLPACSGMAVGLDRLTMLLADANNIDEVLFFPASELFGQSFKK